ncbi:hypothetical protein PTI45_01771 [Paenibacillus nuruki]|uniref:DUF6985 domain-containing protein n=1 Tax=Paenibacillus nuruki TaxID=1886670 RepID=A0A1E3L6K0_9BACL|nr:hypothetical protein [Paenibacillus nuruki]ODP28795.1 hypothetical protein PTI45_01771 [Paenibacillus nuruki]
MSEHLTHIQRHEQDWEAQFHSSLFQSEVSVIAYDLDISTEQAEVAVLAFNHLDEHVIASLCQFSWDYCISFCEYVGDVEAPSIQEPLEILKYIKPTALIVEHLPEHTEPIVHVELECDWEVEHGLEWLVRGQQILYVGSFDGVNSLENESYYQNYSLNFAYGNTYDNL